MLLVHILGGVLVVAGLFLFFREEMDGSPNKDAPAQAAVWKINLTGPSSLVLVLFGVLVFIFPFSGFFKNPEDPNPPPAAAPPTTVVDSSIVDSSTTVVDTTTENTTVFEDLPPAPSSWALVPDDGTCGADIIEWHHADDEFDLIHGWWISIGAYSPNDDVTLETSYGTDGFYEIDTEAMSSELTYGNFSALCYFDFVDPESYFNYDLYIYSFNEFGYSIDPLFIEYNDLVPED